MYNLHFKYNLKERKMPRVQATEDATIHLPSEGRKPIIEVPTFEIGKANLFYKHTDLAAIVMLPKIMCDVQVHSDIILDRLICLGCVSRESKRLKEVDERIQQILLRMYTETFDMERNAAMSKDEILYTIFCEYMVSSLRKMNEEHKVIRDIRALEYGYRTREGWALANRISDFLQTTLSRAIKDSGVASLKQDYIIAASLTDNHQLAFFDFSRFSDSEFNEIMTVGSSIFKSMNAIAIVMGMMEKRAYANISIDGLVSDVKFFYPYANIEEALDSSPWLREVVENIVRMEPSEQLSDHKRSKMMEYNGDISAYTQCCWVTRGLSSAPRVEQHEELKDVYEGRFSATFKAFDARINLALRKPQGSYDIQIETSNAIYILKNLVTFDVLSGASVSDMSFDLKDGEYTSILKFN